MGQEVFNELKAKGEIVESSPLYDQLKPIADAISQAAQPRYNHPFKLLHPDSVLVDLPLDDSALADSVPADSALV